MGSIEFVGSLLAACEAQEYNSHLAYGVVWPVTN